MFNRVVYSIKYHQREQKANTVKEASGYSQKQLEAGLKAAIESYLEDPSDERFERLATGVSKVRDGVRFLSTDLLFDFVSEMAQKRTVLPYGMDRLAGEALTRLYSPLNERSLEIVERIRVDPYSRKYFEQLHFDWFRYGLLVLGSTGGDFVEFFNKYAYEYRNSPLSRDATHMFLHRGPSMSFLLTEEITSNLKNVNILRRFIYSLDVWQRAFDENPELMLQLLRNRIVDVGLNESQFVSEMDSSAYMSFLVAGVADRIFGLAGMPFNMQLRLVAAELFCEDADWRGTI